MTSKRRGSVAQFKFPRSNSIMIIGWSKVKKLFRGPLMTRSGPPEVVGGVRPRKNNNQSDGGGRLRGGQLPRGGGASAAVLPRRDEDESKAASFNSASKELFSWPTSHHNPTTPSLYYIKVKIPLDLAANRFDLAPPSPPPSPLLIRHFSSLPPIFLAARLEICAEWFLVK